MEKKTTDMGVGTVIGWVFLVLLVLAALGIAIGALVIALNDDGDLPKL